MRQRTRIGDVFAVKVDAATKKYFQYIVSDLTQLNSDVIRAFKEKYPIDSTPDLLDIVQGEVEFYAHCVTKLGLKLGYWERVGNVDVVGSVDHILFRGTSDAGWKPGEEVLVSHKWYVWRVNDPEFTRVGRLEGDNRRAEIGVVFSPDNIFNRMQTGRYLLVYPGYE